MIKTGTGPSAINDNHNTTWFLFSFLHDETSIITQLGFYFSFLHDELVSCSQHPSIDTVPARTLL